MATTMTTNTAIDISPPIKYSGTVETEYGLEYKDVELDMTRITFDNDHCGDGRRKRSDTYQTHYETCLFNDDGFDFWLGNPFTGVGYGKLYLHYHLQGGKFYCDWRLVSWAPFSC